MNNQLQVIAEEQGLEQNKIQSLLSNFVEYFKNAQEISKDARSIIVTNEDQVKEMADARKKRLELWKIRCQVENTRKGLKEQSLREGKAIDGMANIIKSLIFPVEEYLEKQEKFAELLAAKRKAERLAERQAELGKYVNDISLYNLSDMPEDAFKMLVENSMKAMEAQKEAEIKAEQERIKKEKKEAQDREKMKKENEKLKKQAEAREKSLAEERKRVAEEKAKQDEIIKKEREAREKIEAEMRTKRLAEEEAKRASQEEERQKLLAPDKDKMRVIYKEIQKVVMDIDLTTLGSAGAYTVAQETIEGLQKVMSNMAEGMKKL